MLLERERVTIHPEPDQVLEVPDPPKLVKGVNIVMRHVQRDERGETLDPKQ